jgi:hypothetical protein
MEADVDVECGGCFFFVMNEIIRTRALETILIFSSKTKSSEFFQLCMSFDFKVMCVMEKRLNESFCVLVPPPPRITLLEIATQNFVMELLFLSPNPASDTDYTQCCEKRVWVELTVTEGRSFVRGEGKAIPVIGHEGP